MAVRVLTKIDAMLSTRQHDLKGNQKFGVAEHWARYR